MEKSDKVWSELSEESKKYIREVFDGFETGCQADLLRIQLMDDLFGKENISPKVRTWKDVEGCSVYDSYNFESNTEHKIVGKVGQITYHGEFDTKLITKGVAMFKIAKLIELGYGGMITDEEWKRYNRPRFYGIVCDQNIGELIVTPLDGTREFISFHTEQQAKDFVKYNLDLCTEYFML